MTSAEAGWGRSQKRIFAAILLLLSILIVILVALLLALPSDERDVTYEPVFGLQPLHVIYGPGLGQDKPLLDQPMGATFGKAGRIYVADTGNNRIVVFDKNAQYLFQFGSLGVAKPAPGGKRSWKPGLFNYPTDVTTDEVGNVYVADFRNDQIQVFDADGEFLRVFPSGDKEVGKGGSGAGGTGIAVTSLCAYEGRVYATDKYQIVVFTTRGKLVSQFGRPGSGPGELDHPNGVAITPVSTVVVSDSNNGRVVSLTPAGRQLWSLGKAVGVQPKPSGGPFEIPRGLTYFTDGSLIVADSLASRLVQLSLTGEVIRTLGERGGAPGQFNFPTDVAAQGDRLVVAEKGNNRIQVVLVGPR